MVAVVGRVADDRVVGELQAVQRIQQPAHLRVEAGAAAVVIGDFASCEVRHLTRHVARQVDIRRIVEPVFVRILRVRPVRRAPGNEQREWIVLPLRPVRFQKTYGEIRLRNGRPTAMARRAALVLEVALVEVVPAGPLHRRQVVQSIAIFWRIGTDAEVPNADVARVVARGLEGAGHGRNVAKWRVLVVDHAVAPAVSAG